MAETGQKPHQSHPTPQQAWDVRAPTVPLKVGWLQPDDISPAAVFLASDAAAMVTGAEYEVTGGTAQRIFEDLRTEQQECNRRRCDSAKDSRSCSAIDACKPRKWSLRRADLREALTNPHRGADQWLYVVAGSGTARVKNRRIPLHPGSLLLIEHGERHEIQNTGRTALKTLNLYAPPAYTRQGNELPAAKPF